MELQIIQPINQIQTQRESLQGLFFRWSSYIDATPRTFQAYTNNTKRFLVWLQRSGISQPTREDVRAYKEEMLKNVKATTVNAYLMALKQFFKWTEQEGLYPNITKGVKGLKLDTEHKKDYLTGRQANKVLKGIEATDLQGLRDYAICALMLTTGLRTVSIVNADVQDIRPVGEQTALFFKGKGHTQKAKYVKLSEQVEDAIRAYLQARGNSKGETPLFASIANRNNGERMTTRSVSRIAKGALVNAGFNSDRLTAHSFRHTAATLALKAGAKETEVQQMLDHTNINTTLIYSHAIERETNNTELKVANAIFNS